MGKKTDLVLSVLLLIAMVLGMCPARGFAEEQDSLVMVEDESTGEELALRPQGASGGEDAFVAEEESLITAESDSVAIAKATIEIKSEQNPSVNTYYYSDLSVALSVLHKEFKYDEGDANRYTTLDLLRDASVTKDYNRDYVVRQANNNVINLNGHTANMNGHTIVLVGNQSTECPIQQMVTISDEQGGGTLENCTICVSGSTYNEVPRPVLVIEGATINGDIGAGDVRGSYVACYGEARLNRGTINGGVTVRVVPPEGSLPGASRFTMVGGAVNGCVSLISTVSAQDPLAQFVMSGGTITNKDGVGVSVGLNTMFAVSGAPVIADSKEGNVYLPNTKTITVDGPLADGASIGVTTETKPTAGSPVVITSGYGESNRGDDPSKYFTSDDPNYCVAWNEDKTEAVLKCHEHAWDYVASGNTITATCANENCPAKGGNEQTLTLDVPNKTYDGQAATAIVTASAGWTTANGLPQVPDASLVTFSSTSVGVGTYTARLSVPGAGKDGGPAVIEKTFRIDPAPLTVTARDVTVAIGAPPTNAGVSYAGFVAGEGPSALAGSLAYDYGGYAAGSAAGAYPITPSGLSAANYAIAYEAGTLTVQPDSLPAAVPVRAVAHLQRIGTLPASAGVGQIVGTTGQSRRLESLRLSLAGQPLGGGMEYRAHIQRVGWQGWRDDGGMAGTEGRSRRLEAVQISLTGQMGEQYDVYYRVHVQRYGWMGWAKNGRPAGTTGESRRAEAVQIVVQRKGSPAPGKTYNGVTQTFDSAFEKR